MKLFIKKRHYLRSTDLITSIRKAQRQIFNTDISPFEATSDSICEYLSIHGKIRKMIRTGNVLQIESVNDSEIVVAEFNYRHDTEIFTLFLEDENGNKYIEIDDEIQNEEIINDSDVINIFYDEDGIEQSPEDLLLHDIFK